MATLNGIITGNVAGDDIDVTRSVSGVPATQTLALAWMTFKTNVTDADPGLLQKAITTASVAGTGQITDTGASGTGVVFFQLTAANTLTLPSGVNVHYDIKVKTSAGKIYTAEQGIFNLAPRITTATS
jgi:cytoskeletal protein RodZ